MEYRLRVLMVVSANEMTRAAFEVDHVETDSVPLAYSHSIGNYSCVAIMERNPDTEPRSAAPVVRREKTARADATAHD